MRVGLMAENPLESAVIASGVVPVAMLEAYAPVYARAVVTATKLGVFEALRGGARPALAVAETCRTDARATEKLLNLLVTMRYLRHSGGGYTLAGHVRRWLLADAPSSIRDVILMKELEWRWIDQLEAFVRDGRPLDVHGTMSTDDWGAYQRGMRAQANPLAPWLARRVPVPAECPRHARHRGIPRLLLGRALPEAPGAAGDGPRPAGRRRARGATPGARGDGRPGRPEGRRRADR